MITEPFLVPNRKCHRRKRYKWCITVTDGHKITQNVLGEHKGITTEQQFLGVILSFFYAFKMAEASAFFCVDAVEAI